MNFLRHPERQDAAVAAKIGKIMENSRTFRNGGGCRCSASHYTTFLAWLTINTIYLGLGNKMVRLGADFNRCRLLQIRNNQIIIFLK